MYLYEILIPKTFQDGTKISLVYHQAWDEFVMSFSGGVTIFRPVVGKWMHDGKMYSEEMIPVRFICRESDLKEILDFTLRHYAQICIMVYRLSDKVTFYYGKQND